MNLRRTSLRLLPFVLVAPLLLQSAAAQAETIYFGPWNISSLNSSNTWSTPSYVTNGQTGGCLTITDDSGEFEGWGFKLVWYDGGKDKVLWSSPEYSPPANLPTQKCAPNESVASGDAKIFEKITVYGGVPGDAASADGNYYVDTY